MFHKLLTAFAVLVLTLAGCGGDSVEETSPGVRTGDAGELPSDTQPADLQGETAPAVMAFDDLVTKASVAPSGRFESTLEVTGYDPDDPSSVAKLVITGAYDRAAQSQHLVVDLSRFLDLATSGSTSAIPPGFSGFLNEPIELITVGDEGWLFMAPLAMLTGQADSWLSMPASEVDSAAGAFGAAGGTSDPDEALEALAGSTVSVTEMGRAEVRGVETRHLLLTTDQDKAMELWIGIDDGLVHRYQTELPPEAVGDGADPTDSIVLTVELFDHGAAVDINPPPEDLVIPGDDLIGLTDFGS